jgi:hypothetical protein
MLTYLSSGTMTRLLLVVVTPLAYLACSGLAKDPLPPEKLDPLLAVIKPQAGEDRWAQIKWRTSLWEARKEAAEKGKPILLWEMDGHPLGCV